MTHHDYIEALRLARHHVQSALIRCDRTRPGTMDHRAALRDLAWRAAVLAQAADEARTHFALPMHEDAFSRPPRR